MFEDIKKAQLIEKVRVMAASGLTGDEIKKSLSKEELTLMKSFSDDIEKGKVAQVGEIREWQGKKVRKQPNGKWVEISREGLTKREHEEKSKEAISNLQNRTGSKTATELDEEDAKHSGASQKLSDKEYDESELSSERPKITDHNKLLEVLSDSELKKLTSSKEYKEKYDEYLKESEPYGITKKDRREANQFALVYAYNNGGLSDEGVKEILTDKQKENLSKYTPEQRKLLLVGLGSAAKTPEQFEKLKAIGEYFKELDEKSSNQGKVEEIDFSGYTAEDMKQVMQNFFAEGGTNDQYYNLVEKNPKAYKALLDVAKKLRQDGEGKVEEVDKKRVKNIEISEEYDSLKKLDKQKLLDIFSRSNRVHGLSEKDPKSDILNAIMSEKYRGNWDYIPKSKR